MKRFIRKIGLLDDLQMELQMEKVDFVKKLRSIVDLGEPGTSINPFEAFSSSKNYYKGEVDLDGFKFKKKQRMFDTNMNFSKIEGDYKQVENKLIINSEINGFHGAMIPFYIFIILFYAVMIFAFFLSDNVINEAPIFIFPFLVIHAFLMLGMPYLMMKKGVKRMKYDIEREFYFLTKE